MRNLLEYPITTEEVIGCLDELIAGMVYEGEARHLVGVMRPLLLVWARARVIECEEIKRDAKSCAIERSLKD
jgi:hypothetical protein